MQGLKGVLAVATIVGVSGALGGCFAHHHKRVDHVPMKIGAADMAVEQVEQRATR